MNFGMRRKMQIIRNSFVVFTFDFIMGITEKKVAWINVLHRKLGMRTQNEKGELVRSKYGRYLSNEEVWRFDKRSK